MGPVPPLAFLHARVLLHWGFSVRQVGASAAQLAYVLPPPPTVVGAFMNPLARALGLGELLSPGRGPATGPAMECALRATVAASAGLEGDVGVAVHAEPSRILAAPYKSGGSYTRALRQPPYTAADELLPVQATGSASSPSRMHLAWLVDAGALGRCLGRGVDPELLEAAAWSVYRLGSREGLASVLEARAYGPEELEEVGEGSEVETVLYQPGECVEPALPEGVVKVALYDLSYREAEFYAPGSLGGPSFLLPPRRPALLTLRSGCRAVRPRRRPELALAYRV